MKYCYKHTCWHDFGCPKCKANEPAYMRHRTEVNDHKELKDLKEKGWLKDE